MIFASKLFRKRTGISPGKNPVLVGEPMPGSSLEAPPIARHVVEHDHGDHVVVAGVLFRLLGRSLAEAFHPPLHSLVGFLAIGAGPVGPGRGGTLYVSVGVLAQPIEHGAAGDVDPASYRTSLFDGLVWDGCFQGWGNVVETEGTGHGIGGLDCGRGLGLFPGTGPPVIAGPVGSDGFKLDGACTYHLQRCMTFR